MPKLSLLYPEQQIWVQAGAPLVVFVAIWFAKRPSRLILCTFRLPFLGCLLEMHLLLHRRYSIQRPQGVLVRSTCHYLVKPLCLALVCVVRTKIHLGYV